MQTEEPPEAGAREERRSEPDPLMDRRVEEPDRRQGDRRQGDRRQEAKVVPSDRRARPDRRQSDRRGKQRGPRTINQYDVTGEEMEFINAVVQFRQRTGNRFPKARDILEILKKLGYRKQPESE